MAAYSWEGQELSLSFSQASEEIGVCTLWIRLEDSFGKKVLCKIPDAIPVFLSRYMRLYGQTDRDKVSFWRELESLKAVTTSAQA